MDYGALQELAKTAGINPPDGSQIRIEGDDPIYPSPLPLGGGAATAIAMIAAGIDDIWYAKTGRRQPIDINLRHAAVTISSMLVLRVNGGLGTEQLAADAGGNPVVGTYRCRDGRWMLLMDSFPRLAAAALEILGWEPTPEAIGAAVAARDSDELESAFVAAKLTGVVIREPHEWLEHPQGQWLKDRPVVELERIGEAPPTPLPDGPRPLSGLRVIDSTRVLAGPTISRTLAEFGADVLHVGSPNVPDLVVAQADTGHGKRRAFIDLETERDQSRLTELAKGADVFSQSYRAGAMEDRGFGPEALAALRPGVIYVSENCYGPGGPWQHKRGFDGNAQAASGIMRLNGWNPENDIFAQGPAMAMNDYCTGYWGAYGVLEALKRRATEGGSWHVKVSLSQTARWFLRMEERYDMSKALSSDEIFGVAAEFSESVSSAYGELQRLKNVIRMPETPPEWVLPTVLPGTHEAAWALTT